MDLGQVFTNKNVAEYMISLFCLKKNAVLLDPCFGKGAFLQAAFLNGYTNIEGYEIDFDLYILTKQKYPELNLYNQDFLSADSEKKYDGIIMNPPYIRQEKIDDLKPLGITKRILRQNKLFDSLPSTANLYMYFIYKSIELLKDNGEMVVIFPSSWLQAKSGKQFEKSLYSKCTLIKQIHITGEVFEKNALVEVVILHLKKGLLDIDAVIENVEISNGRLVPFQMVSTVDELGFASPFFSLGSVRRGLTTGCNSMYINPPFEDSKSMEHLIPIISTPKAIEGYSTKNAKTDYLFVPRPELGFTLEIINYISEWKENIKLSGQPKSLLAKINVSDYWYLIKPIDSVGILFSYFVRNDMKFVFNNMGCFARDNFYIIKPKIDSMLAFALLNNYYTFFQLEKAGKKYGAGLLKLQRYDIEELKFPNFTLFLDNEIEQIKALSKELIFTGKADLVSEITKIIANHADVNYETIVDHYFSIKKQRLEGSANE
jgi:adenine-specific DNA-methyltransferase